MNDATQFFDTTAGGGYEIERSLRFNSSDSAYLSRTPASAGNRKTWTWAGWVKRCKLGTFQTIISAGNSSPAQRGGIRLWNTDVLDIAEDSGGYILQTAQVFRDVSAWFHLVVAFDSTQATSTNRIKVYVNGSQVTTFSTATYPSQNFDSIFNTTDPHRIGELSFAGNIYELDAYLADLHFIDGQALDPTSFGKFDANGVWQPKAYTGTYGTNGFHLPFSDNSTTAALGTDTSGNSNTWTVNNISVAAGSGNDSLVDTPTNYGVDAGNGGEVRGNYCTWNPLIKSTYASISNGILDIVSSSTHGQTLGTIGVSSGKWYWEITKSTSGNPFTAGFGVMEQSYKTDTAWVGSGTGRNFVYLQSGDVNWYDGSAGSGAFTNSTLVNNNGVWMFALDLDNQKFWFGKDGVWYSRTGTTITGPSSGLNAPFTSFNTGSTYFPFHNSDSTAVTYVANFGQRPFAYTAPSGFKALCTTNLPDPVVAQPSEVMDVALWTGNGSARSITGLGFNPDLVWIKGRSTAYDHRLFDAVRGANLAVASNLTAAEYNAAGTELTAFNSNGFSLGNSVGVNNTATTYVAWCWDAGSSTVTNTDGSITSSVRANASAGFSIVTFSMVGGTNTVGHGLGTTPSLVILKSRANSSGWVVYHASTGAGGYTQLNLTDAYVSSSGTFNNTAPTSSVFTVSTDFSGLPGAFLAYCFAPVEGYSAFGSYTGNGSTDGTFVYTGFRPRWIMWKRTDTTSQWSIYDSLRNGLNVDNDALYANLSNAETNSVSVDILSNGFKLRDAGWDDNASGGTYIYAAFAENPFKYARAR